ncbi:hypothetical protein LTS02_017869 [Friedmanniomyces endolithicus]|nr:hypothetical protein LTS02_017869 [Friedmanniomyces endolithicus]
MADGSMFARLDDEEQILTVDMNEVAILEPDDDYVAIGTRDLNACSGVVIMGRGIIMAHISPYPTGRSDNGNSDGLAGMRHFAELLAEVRDLHNQHSTLFSDDAVGWGISARFEGEVPLEHHIDLATRMFSAMGLPQQPAFCDVHIPRRDDSPPAKGTAVALRGTRTREPQLFVEDVLQIRNGDRMTRAQQQPTIAPPAMANTGTTASSTAGRWVHAGGRYPSTEYSNHDVERKYPLKRDGMGETVTLHDEGRMPEHVYGTPIKQLSVGMSRDLREELPYASYYIMRLLTKRM